ncbi:MAG: tetratricopeptide repeat protein [Pyrinomonadaceae bacterium]
MVVDERLAALRAEPNVSAALVRRLGRGRLVTIVGPPRQADGLSFYRVAVTRRTRGWLPSESLAVPSRPKEAERLWRLIEASEDFEQLVRAGIFLDLFPRSPLRPRVLLLFGDAAEKAAARLSREAARRFDAGKLDGGAPARAYFLNYSGLDRYNRQGVVFTFDPATKLFHYDGGRWREVLRRHPRSPEAIQARQRLGHLSAVFAQ